MMSQSRPLDPAIPGDVKARLEEFTRSLVSLLSQDLVALVIHGSAVRGGYVPGSSDIDGVVVLREPTAAKLESIGNVVRMARFSARIECMILDEAEIARSADVFPLLYEDIAACHHLAHGKDVFSAITVHPEHRRLRIEQELREVEIRLRRVVTDNADDDESLGAALERKVKQLRSPLNALVRLRGKNPADSVHGVLEAAGELFGISMAPLHNASAAPEVALAVLGRLLKAAVDDVDRMETGGHRA
jgi:predicted nucleotidyltransferase